VTQNGRQYQESPLNCLSWRQRERWHQLPRDAYCYFVGQTYQWRHKVGHAQTCLLQQMTLSDESVKVLHSTAWWHWWAFFRLQKMILAQYWFHALAYRAADGSSSLSPMHAWHVSNKTIDRFLLVHIICSIILKKLPFEVLQNAVREKKLQNYRNWHFWKFVCGLFWSILGKGIFGNFGTGRGNFPVSGREFPVAL